MLSISINNVVFTTFLQVLFVGFTIVLFQFCISKFKIKDWSELFFGVIFFCTCVVLILLSIIPVLSDFEKLRLPFFKTFPISLIISFFLYFFIPKTKKFEDYKKKRNIENTKRKVISVKLSFYQKYIYDEFSPQRFKGAIAEIVWLVFILFLFVSFISFLIKFIL